MTKQTTLLAVLGALALPSAALAQATGTPKSYTTPYTWTPPTIDGVVTPGEWDAAPAAGGWGILRRDEADIDADGSRFRMMWDDNYLYILVQSNNSNWSPANDTVNQPHVPGSQIQGISFGATADSSGLSKRLAGCVNINSSWTFRPHPNSLGHASPANSLRA